MRKVVLFVTLVVLLAVPAAHAGNILVNGSFEAKADVPGLVNHINLNALSPSSWDVYAAIPGWTTTVGAGIEIQANSVVGAFDGERYVELDSHPHDGIAATNSTMTQTVSLGPGAYLLSFYYQPRTAGPDLDNLISVYFGGNLLESISLYNPPVNYWKPFSYALNVASVGNYDLTFSAVGGTQNQLGGFIDGVSLGAVPEPASLLLLGTGLVGLGRSWRKRRA